MVIEAFRRPAAIMLACGLLAAVVPAHGQVIATVDGAEITEQDASLALEDIGATLPQQMSSDQRREYVINYLIDLKLTAKKAAADKLDQGAEFERKMAYFRDKARMQAMLDTIRAKAVTEAEIKKVYDEAAKAQGSEPEVKASHILVETEEQAKDALKRVRGGEDFAKVATEVSKDPGSPGGALGWFEKGQMVPEFAEMAFKTNPGQISEPVKTRFGWHVIKVEEKRTKAFPPLDQVRDQVERFITRKAHTEAIQGLRGSARIEQIPSAPILPPLKP
jgi:peptidyl-prolyl cis-trans isomerase C